MRTSVLAMGLLTILTGAAAQSEIVVTTTSDVTATDDFSDTFSYNDISVPESDDDNPAPVDSVPTTPGTSSAAATSTLEPDASAPTETPSPMSSTTETLSPVEEASEGGTPAPIPEGAEDPDDAQLDDDLEYGVGDDVIPSIDDPSPEVDTVDTDGAAGALGGKSGATWGGAAAVGALGAAVLGLF